MIRIKKVFVLVALSITVLGVSYILVSVKPLYLIVRELTGMDTEILIDPRTNPHMFQLKPSDVSKIEKANVFLVLGNPFESWLPKVKKVNVCVVTKGLEKTMMENPHVWLDPVMASFMAVEIADCIKRTYPSESESVDSRLLDFLGRMVNLSEKFQKDFSGKIGSTVLELRPALFHFINRFLEGNYITLVSETQSGLTPRRLKEVLTLCKKLGLKKIIVEKNSSERIAYPLIRSCKLEILRVDVLGTDHDDFFDFMEDVEKTVLEAIE